jgi:peptidoglycan hydrolase CwlO-like protein
MSDVFVGDNDHGDAIPPTDVLLQMIKLLREDKVRLEEDIVQLAYELNELQALYKHDESVAKSYEKIATKYHATLEKLAQEESTNEN